MTEIRLTKARTFELDPSKAYLIQVKSGALRADDVEKLNDQLTKMGIKNAVAVILPKNQHLKIVEASPKKGGAS